MRRSGCAERSARRRLGPTRLIAGLMLAATALPTPVLPALAAPAGASPQIQLAPEGMPPRQSDPSAGETETVNEPSGGSDAGRMATVVAVLNQQGAESAEILSRVAGVPVINPLPMPEPTTDRPEWAPGAAQTAEANAAATATAVAATEVARAVQATAEARATEAVATERARAEATAAASATAVANASATAAANASATAAATPAAAKAVPTQPAAVAAVSADDEPAAPAALLRLAGRSLLQAWPASPVPALAAAVAALLGLLIWRRRREPFVLKAKPVRA